MKRVALTCLFLLPLVAQSKGGHKISRPVTSTTSLGEPADRLTFSFENDSYPTYYQTEYGAPTITYAHNGWEVGFGSQNILLSTNLPSDLSTAQNFQNDTYLNVAKTFGYTKLDKHLSFLTTTIGTQTGLALPLSSSVDPGYVNNATLHEFYFIDNDLDLLHKLWSVHVGPYYSNAAITTTRSYVGWLAGTQVVVWPKTVRVNADTYSGHSNVSGSTFQLTYSYNNNFELFGGYGRAASNSGNYDYFILGVNLIAIIK